MWSILKEKAEKKAGISAGDRDFSGCNMDVDAETIAAVATADGPAGVAIVRISGAQAWAVASRVVQCNGLSLSDRRPGHFFRGTIINPVHHGLVDDGIVLLFRAPLSFTGEDVVEIHGHGGRMATRHVLDAVLAGGARLAIPGEFTRRAFLNGKMDLTQAEAVMDLVQARSDRAAKAAHAQMAGALRTSMNRCYERAMEIRAQIEVRLDFDEDELTTPVLQDIGGTIQNLRADLARLLKTSQEGYWLRTGVSVVIAGCPNAGKSSLMNALLGWSRAIVSPYPGTTRDTLEESFILDGFPLRLTDTAGLRETGCQIEQEGVLRANQALDQAAIIIFVIDGAYKFQEQKQTLISTFADLAPSTHKIIAINKTDIPICLSVEQVQKTLEQIRSADTPIICLSALTGTGLDELKAGLLAALNSTDSEEGQIPIAERHQGELLRADHLLQEILSLLEQDETSLVIAAEQAKSASEALGRVTGRVYSEELLDMIFSRFCIGK